MESKTVFSFFALFMCLLQSGSSNVIPNLIVNFEQNLNDVMEREYHVIGLIRDANDKGEFIKGPLKEPYRSIISNTITEMVNELQEHYDELKQESAKSEVVPNMENNLIEAKLVEIAPKYIDKIVNQILAEINANPTIPTKTKIVVNRETTFVVKKINGIIIPALLTEIKNNPKDWIAANPIEAMSASSRLPKERRLHFEKIGERLQSTFMTLQIAVAQHVDKLSNELKNYIEVFYEVPTYNVSEKIASSEIENESE